MNDTPHSKHWRGIPLSVWEYLGELILATLSCVLFRLHYSTADLLELLCRLRSDLLVGVAAAMALSCGVWIGLLAIFASDFGAWLRKRGEASVYSRALATPVVLYMAVFAITMFAPCRNSPYSAFLNLFGLVYGAINFITIVRNVQGLIDLWQTWENARKK